MFIFMTSNFSIPHDLQSKKKKNIAKIKSYLKISEVIKNALQPQNVVTQKKSFNLSFC